MDFHDIIMLPGAETQTAFLLNLIGGLFARSDAKKRDRAAAEAAKVPVVTTHKVDLKGMVREGMEAGFNPMSILMNGGMAGWTTTSTTGQNAMAAVPTAPSVGSVIAGAAIKTVDDLRSDGWFRAPSPEYAAQTLPTIGGGYAPTGALSAMSFGGKVGNGGQATVNAGNNPFGFELKTPTVTESIPGLLKSDPYWADAESVTAEYEDLISMPYGVWKLYQNTLMTVTGKSKVERDKVYQDLSKKAGAAVTNAYDSVRRQLEGMSRGVAVKGDYYVDPYTALSPGGGYDKVNPLR